MILVAVGFEIELRAEQLVATEAHPQLAIFSVLLKNSETITENTQPTFLLVVLVRSRLELLREFVCKRGNPLLQILDAKFSRQQSGS
jgi:hypothetical protein